MPSRTTRFAMILAATILCTASLLANGAIPDPAPELDGTALSTGIAALAAGVLIVRARWHKK